MSEKDGRKKALRRLRRELRELAQSCRVLRGLAGDGVPLLPELADLMSDRLRLTTRSVEMLALTLAGEAESPEQESAEC